MEETAAAQVDADVRELGLVPKEQEIAFFSLRKGNLVRGVVLRLRAARPPSRREIRPPGGLT